MWCVRSHVSCPDISRHIALLRLLRETKRDVSGFHWKSLSRLRNALKSAVVMIGQLGKVSDIPGWKVEFDAQNMAEEQTVKRHVPGTIASTMEHYDPRVNVLLTRL